MLIRTAAVPPFFKNGYVVACEHTREAVLKDDGDVRPYLLRLRERRELGLYWYATGQLAALGDAAARREFWKAMDDGRYRILYTSDVYPKTLGLDLSATMPFWMEQLRSSCCRAVTSAGEPWRALFDVETFEVPWRTPYACAASTAAM